MTPIRRVELRNLATGETRAWQDIGTFAFAQHLHAHVPPPAREAKRRRPEADAAAAAATPPAQPPAGQAAGTATGGRRRRGAPRGVDALVLDLGTGRHQFLGSVADIAFNRTGELLAYTVDAAQKDVNGLFVFDTRTGRTVTLDSDAKSYNRLTWNEDGHAVAVLKGSDVEKMRERDNVLVAFPDITPSLKDGGGGARAGRARSIEGGRVPEGLGRVRPRDPRLERRQRSGLLRNEGAGAGTRHDAQVHGRGRGRGRVEHRRRPRAVAADEPREPGPELHVPDGVRRLGAALRQAGRRDDEGPGPRAGRQVGRRAGRARVPSRPEEGAGSRLLPREHDHRRSHA